MMELPLYQVDAFADALFAGNPAAVVPLPNWLPDTLLQQIAAENNLPETAFIVPAGADYELRWFTPSVEVPLCGHATLASAFIVFRFLEPDATRVQFRTRVSGVLSVTRDRDLLTLDLPSHPTAEIPLPAGLAAALGARPVAVQGKDMLLAVFETAADIAALKPDFRALAALPVQGLIVTAPGEGDIDFVSRFFAPSIGIDEDPVTGGAHCVLVPYWAARLGRTVLKARQISARGGLLLCENRGERVALSGTAVLYLTGSIHLE
jgi:PhzF family phenazine biosynthesis protein